MRALRTAATPWAGRRLRALLGLTIALALAGAGAGAAPTRDPVTTHDLQELFHAYGDAGAYWMPGDERTWTGADTTFSIELPDGRTLWVFSDTFLAPSNGCGPEDPEPCHKRVLFGAPFINNSFVVQERDGSLSRTIHGGTSELPAAAVTPPAPANEASFYWMGDGTVEGDRLHLFVRRYPKSPVLPPSAIGTDVATFRLPDLTLERISEGAGPEGLRPWAFGPVPGGAEVPVTWGAGILEQADHTYIYGTEEHTLFKRLHVARVPAGQLLTAPWEYFDGAGWSTDPLRSARIADNVAGELSVVQTTGGYRLVASLIGIAEIRMSTAPRPEGPWAPFTTLYIPPELAKGAQVYNAHEHPQYSRKGSVVLSYNVNGSMDGNDVFSDVHIYRARFVEIVIDDPVRVVRTRPGR